MGRIAATLLAHGLRIGQEWVTQTLVRPQLVERQSVRDLTAVPSYAAAPT
jgi:DNA-binding LacI/PurR family transcriptional regulator